MNIKCVLKNNFYPSKRYILLIHVKPVLPISFFRTKDTHDETIDDYIHYPIWKHFFALFRKRSLKTFLRKYNSEDATSAFGQHIAVSDFLLWFRI